MTGATIPEGKQLARIATVKQHIRLENRHDLDGILSTFGDTPRYDDEPWHEHYDGRDGVRQFYKQLMTALPDLEIEVRQQHVAYEAILVEVTIRGTHLGGWKDRSPTGVSLAIRKSAQLGLTSWLVTADPRSSKDQHDNQNNRSCFFNVPKLPTLAIVNAMRNWLSFSVPKVKRRHWKLKPQQSVL